MRPPDEPRRTDRWDDAVLAAAVSIVAWAVMALAMALVVRW